MQDIKKSPEAPILLAMQNALLPFVPIPLARQTLFDMMRRHSVVFSNVPGPPEPCVFAGKEAVGVQMFFSQLIPQIGFVSYRGSMFGNLLLDPECVPNAASIPIFYSKALVELASKFGIDAPDSIRSHAETPLPGKP